MTFARRALGLVGLGAILLLCADVAVAAIPVTSAGNMIFVGFIAGIVQGQLLERWL